MLKSLILLAALSILPHVGSTFLQQRAPNVVSATFTRRTNALTPAGNANKLRKRQKTVTSPLANAEIAYLINITIGTPPQPFTVQLDTGSADLWVISSDAPACVQSEVSCQALGSFNLGASSTARVIGQNGFSIGYQDNSAVQGDYVTDDVAIQQTTISNLTFGLATSATRSLGIMGIGYVSDESIAATDPSSTYPNIVQALKNSGAIRSTSYSLWLDDDNVETGSILFGGVDSAKYQAPLTALPIQKTVNGTYRDVTVALSAFAMTDAAGKQAYAQSNLGLPVILDCGTTDTYLPNNIVEDIVNGIGAINNPLLGLIVPCYLANSKAFFTFTFGGPQGAAIRVPFSEFVSPIYNDDGSQPRFRDGSGTVCGLGLQPAGDPSQPILLGDTFLRSAYVVYDLANNQVAIANSKANATDSNVVEISQASMIPGVAATATQAVASQAYTGNPLQTENARKGGHFDGGSKSPTFNLGVDRPNTGTSLSYSISLVFLTAATISLASGFWFL